MFRSSRVLACCLIHSTFVVGLAHADCNRLCNYLWWEKATIPAVKFAINSGENVNGNFQSFTPLHIASWKSNASNVSILLRHGAKVNSTAKNSYYWTPLHIAAMMGTVETVKLLIENNATVDIKDSVGFTPLHYAGIRGDKKIIDVLIASGGNIADLRYKR